MSLWDLYLTVHIGGKRLHLASSVAGRTLCGIRAYQLSHMRWAGAVVCAACLAEREGQNPGRGA